MQYTIATVIILNAYFIIYRCAQNLIDENIVYCIVCFKNKGMYNLMAADIAAETCRY